MKTQTTKLTFNKNSILELNDKKTKKIIGGGFTIISKITTITDFSKNTLCQSDVK